MVGLALTTLVLACGREGSEQIDLSWIAYPAVERGSDTDVYHGVEVADPYRALEDESAEATKAWVAVQDNLTERFFAQLPEREKAVAYLNENWLDGVVMAPIRRGDNAFFFKAVEGKPHNVLYMIKGDGEPEVVFDLNENDPDGLASIPAAVTASPNGRYVGYSIQYAGADAAENHFFDTETGEKLDEFIPEAWTGVSAWLPDESGFIYSYMDLQALRGQPTDKQPGIYRHTIGTPIEEDVLVYDRPWQGQYMAGAVMADDEEHLLIQDLNIMGSRGGWGYRPIEGGADTPVTWLIEPRIENRFAFIGSSGSEVFLVTDYPESPNWRIVAIDLNRPGLDNLREVVPELEQPISVYAGTNAGNIVLHDDRLYVTYIQDNIQDIRIYDVQGESLGEIPLPFPGRVGSINAKKDDPVLYLSVQSWLVPASTIGYNTETGDLIKVEAVEAPDEFSDYEVQRVFYSSYDGTRIPMTIIHRKGLVPDGETKVMLYGYGGWGIPLLPGFHNRIHAWLHMGGIYALANLRGGGEYGDAWHQAGQFMNKQNVFDDYAAAAEYLVAEGYTTASRIAIIGASNGGLLTAASYNQRPELFGAVISEVAAVDMLRFQPEMFEYLRSYSPLHNVRHEGPYPPILNVVGENDPRCKPGHIFKYVAELQRMGDSDRLALMRLVRGAGHGSGRKDAQVQWLADELAFGWAMTE
jgi:prolyl oligopeptidase